MKLSILALALLIAMVYMTAEEVTCRPMGDEAESSNRGGNGEVETTTLSPYEKAKALFGYDSEDEEEEDEDKDDEQGGPDLMAHEKCILCYNNFKKEKPVEIACHHKYHASCLRDYYDQTNKQLVCFMCQKPMTLANGLNYADQYLKDKVYESIENKLRIGILSGLGILPAGYANEPRNY